MPDFAYVSDITPTGFFEILAPKDNSGISPAIHCEIHFPLDYANAEIPPNCSLSLYNHSVRYSRIFIRHCQEIGIDVLLVPNISRMNQARREYVFDFFQDFQANSANMVRAVEMQYEWECRYAARRAAQIERMVRLRVDPRILERRLSEYKHFLADADITEERMRQYAESQEQMKKDMH